MELSIISDQTNPAASRREISFSVVQDDKTASKEEIKKELCSRLNLSPDTTIIVSVRQEFGVRRSVGVAHSYASKEQMDGSEPGYLTARLSKMAGRQEAPAKKEEPEAEKPAKREKEETKEEKKE